MSLISTAKRGGEIGELDGAAKAAILLLALNRDTAGALLKRLPTADVEAITREIASLGEVPPDLAQGVVEEFDTIRKAAQRAREGGLEYARSLLTEALDPATAHRIIAHIEAQVRHKPFAFLQKAEPQSLLAFVQDEHPQTIAMILSHLPHDQAAEILTSLPLATQVEVVRRLATLEQAGKEVIETIEDVLAPRVSRLVSHPLPRPVGVEVVAEVLTRCDRASERSMLGELERSDPDLVEQIRRRLFVFEDILLVDDRGVQALLKEVDNDELCLALKTASEELQEKVFSNMSERAANLIREDMEYMGPVRLSDVETAQQRIVDIVRRLEDAGEITIAGRGREGDVLV